MLENGFLIMTDPNYFQLLGLDGLFKTIKVLGVTLRNVERSSDCTEENSIIYLWKSKN